MEQRTNNILRTNNEDDGDPWYLPVLSIIMLLICYFIVVIHGEDPSSGSAAPKDGDVTSHQVRMMRLYSRLEPVLHEVDSTGGLALTLIENEIRLVFPDKAFYAVGDAGLQPFGRLQLMSLIGALQQMQDDRFLIDIEGHTDTLAINSIQYPTNWELSVARASAVARLFIENGIRAERVKASGFGEFRPVVPNTDANGAIIPSHLAKNRRIVLRFHPDTSASVLTQGGG